MFARGRLADLIGAVPRGIGRAKKRDQRRTYRRGKMQGACVASNSACSTAQERHQFAEAAVMNNRGGVTACTNNGCRQIVVSRTGIHDSAQAKRLAEPRTQSSKALRRPAFGAPATAGAEDNVAIQSLRTLTGADCGFILLWNMHAHPSGGTFGAGAQ